ncbi:MAG TPA: hypothetical protein PKO15_09830 [Fibrobacteria bacterium]|mgnify:FL=1|nr:hypothetical protein [Fibrobacteria bacterium]
MRSHFGLVLAGSLFLVGCGPTLTSQAGMELLKGGKPSFPTAKAARINHQAVLVHGGKTLRFQIWTVADSVAGRMEASGPLGIGLATVIWDDTSWQASLPGQATLLQGKERALNLPVLNLRDVTPSRLVAPFLGRGWLGEGDFRAYPADPHQTLLLPVGSAPTWSLLLDNWTGLPLRRQTLSQGREVEAISFFEWRMQGNIPVPGRLIRTTSDGQRLELQLKEWSSLEGLPSSLRILNLPAGTDTIIVGTGENGRKSYQVHQPVTEPTSSQTTVPSDDPNAESDGEWDDETGLEPLAPAQEEQPPAKQTGPGNP